MMQSWKAGSRGTQVVKTIRKWEEEITCVLIDERSRSVFVGTNGKVLNQISLQSKKKIKKYSDLEIGRIQCLSSFHNLIFVGGYNDYRFTLISIVERKMLTIEPVTISINWIKCSKFTVINQNNNLTAIISVSGGKPKLLYLIGLIVQ